MEQLIKRRTRGKTQRFSINEKYIFGGYRCMRCGEVVKDEESMNFICQQCKKRGLRK